MIFKSKEERDKFIINHMYLIDSIVRKYSKDLGIDTQELMSYGYEGLIKGADKYDASVGKASNYLYRYIMGYILHGIEETQNECTKKSYYKYLEAKKEVENNTLTTLEEDPVLLAEVMNVMETKVKLSKKQRETIECNVLGSMTEPLQQHKEDLVYPEEVQFYYATVGMRESVIHDFIESMLKYQLSETQRTVLVEAYGLDGEAPRSLLNISKRYDVSPEGIRKIHKRALKKLNEYIQKKSVQSSLELAYDYIYRSEMVDDCKKYYI